MRIIIFIVAFYFVLNKLIFNYYNHILSFFTFGFDKSKLKKNLRYTYWIFYPSTIIATVSSLVVYIIALIYSYKSTKKIILHDDTNYLILIKSLFINYFSLIIIFTLLLIVLVQTFVLTKKVNVKFTTALITSFFTIIIISITIYFVRFIIIAILSYF